jgi:hypothetical protein
MSNLLKNLLIVLGLAIILFVGYVVFIKGDSEDEYLLESQNASSIEAELETQRLLVMLNELKALDISGEIFTDPLFLSLQDFRIDLGEEPTGRSNPFAPVQ